MDKMKMLQRIKQIYDSDSNVISYLKDRDNKSQNELEDILISYDFQAGTYTADYKEDSLQKNSYCGYLGDVMNEIGNFNSLIEVGVGEATTLVPLLKTLNRVPERIMGFDISWSRIKYAKKFIDGMGISSVDLFTADLFEMPLKDDSIDIVYTSHSIEPNGGKEKEALIELYRITNKYLILLEPAYELASEEAKNRMKEHGYITNLYQTALDLNYNVIEYRLFDVSANLLNPTGLLIISKEGKEETLEPFCCPITKTDILINEDSYYSPESLLAYPIISGIPCLLAQNAIVATKYMD